MGGQTEDWATSCIYVVKSGDKLCVRQYQSNGYGGPNVQFTDGTQTYGLVNDAGGQPISALNIELQWDFRVFDLSGFAGKTVNDYQAVTDSSSPAGTYDIYYGEIAIVSTNGSVATIYDGAQGATFPVAANAGQTNLSAIEERSEYAVDSEQPRNVTAFYHYVGKALGMIK